MCLFVRIREGVANREREQKRGREIPSFGCGCWWYKKVNRCALIYISATSKPPLISAKSRGKKTEKGEKSDSQGATGEGKMGARDGRAKEKMRYSKYRQSEREGAKWRERDGNERQGGGRKVTKRETGGRREHRGEKSSKKESMESCYTLSCIPRSPCTSFIAAVFLACWHTET